MSASDPVPAARHRLSVRVVRDDPGAAGRTSDETEITVLDAAGRPVGDPGFGWLRADLPRGVYCVRTRLLGATHDVPVVLDAPRDVEVPAFRVRTATPMDGGAFTHEYYSHTSAQISATETHTPLGTGAPLGRVFVFVRAEQRGTAGGTRVGRGLRIANTRGRKVAAFEGNGVRRDGDAGFVALSANATPGWYRLHIPGSPVRIVPLHVYPHVQTQVFLFDRDGTRADTLKVFLRRKQRFEPDDPELRVADVAIDALAHLRPGETRTRSPVPAPVAQRLLEMKFDDPMLGLLGAYLAFHRQGGVPPWVLDNLDHLIPGSPDVRVLRLATAEAEASRTGGTVPAALTGPLDEPPLLRYGTELALAASARHASLVPEGSALDRIAARLLVDLAWTSWTTRVSASQEIVEEAPSEETLELLDDLSSTASIGELAEAAEAEDSGSGGGALGFAFTRARGARPSPKRRGRKRTRRVTWVEHALRDLGATPQSDAAGLAARLRLPVATVRRALRGLGNAAVGE